MNFLIKMKLQEIINNRVALVMFILSLVISFYISYNIITEEKMIEVGTNDFVRGNSVSNSNSLSLYTCITKCLFAFLLGGIVNDMKFIKIGLV